MTTTVDLRRELRGALLGDAHPGPARGAGAAFLMIDGHGDPNTAPAYDEAVEAL